MRQTLLLLALIASLTACDNFTPTDKVVGYDPATGKMIPPHPCPDWSQTQTYNYKNEVHSNFGCAVNTDDALQIADPQDLVRGHGGTGPDTGISTHVIELYRAGTLPTPLQPMQDSGTAGGSSAQ